MSHEPHNQMTQPPTQTMPSQPTTLTITEMRSLHHSALQSVESKRTELRLVLASRYRELVGSSDEVTRMRERAEELNDLVGGLGGLVDGVLACQSSAGGDDKLSADSAGADGGRGVDADNKGAVDEDESEESTQQSLFTLPRFIHRHLDTGDVHSAAFSLVDLFTIIHQNANKKGGIVYPLAAALAKDKTHAPTIVEKIERGGGINPIQTKMIYLHIQTLPSRIVTVSKSILIRPCVSAHSTAAALSALDLLSVTTTTNTTSSSSTTSSTEERANHLLDLYYESKATLLNGLLQKLSLNKENVTDVAEGILSDIVGILQYDVILYPYLIFVLRRFPLDGGGNSENCGGSNTNDESNGDSNNIEGSKCAKISPTDESTIQKIMSTLPPFNPHHLKSKTSRFLSAHLPLIRTKVKSILMIIAGTTASKLGRIRQTLYDKTDGVECMRLLDENGVCSWEQAVSGTVDVRVVSHGGEEVRFSLWGALFSNTFSSLVHSLLTASFHSVHSRVVHTLRTSLARAPQFEVMLPHEAHRNALRMATDLDGWLRKVSDDAHELLVHAEEREESERRLRQSLYVQTCEIMGRLLNELRRMLLVKEENCNPGRELIVGRLCHLLKFRLKTLPTLLDPKSSPAALAGMGGGKSTGMITRFELHSSFDLADDDDDGLISFDEAMEAMESAFSGTHFHGAEMVRDTLLLVQSSTAGVGGLGAPVSGGVTLPANSSKKSAPKNVTLSELALLSARGLRHDATGPESALGTVQSSLDEIVHSCFKEWARAALSHSLKSFTNTLHDCIGVACTVSDMEWRRLNSLLEKEDDSLLKEICDAKGDGNKLRPKKTVVGQVSPHVVSYLLALAGVLNRSVCPADSLPPVPSLEYAQTLGISLAEKETVPNMMLTIRGSLLSEALTSLSRSLNQEIVSSSDEDGVSSTDGDTKLNKCSPSSLIQMLMDIKFIYRCFFERNHHGFGFGGTDDSFVNGSQGTMEDISKQLSKCVKLAVVDGSSIDDAITERHSRVFSSCDLFLSSLFGESDADDSSSDMVSNGIGRTSLLSVSSDSSFLLNPLASSRRFVLLPIQAEKLTELQLRGKYGKKTQEEKTSSATATSGNAIGFGFLSSMLSTKTRQ